MNTASKFLITLVLTTVQTGIIQAIQATPFPVTVTQPDGTSLTIRLYGDEHGAMMFTTDGLPVICDPGSRRYEFAFPYNGVLQSSGIQATDPGQRPASVHERLRDIDPAEALKLLDHRRHNSMARKNSPQKIKISNYPTLGQQKALAILVEFDDLTFSSIDNPYKYYNGMLNSEGFTWSNGAEGSVRDFYLASSDGRFDPEFVVVGPVKLQRPCEYYGQDDEYLDIKCYDMVMEAASAVDATVDYSEFDTDGDGYVDNIYFFYAGYGQADSGKSETIWPHSGTLEEAWGRELILDGVHINRYACSNEIRGGSYPVQPVGIGTFVHEFGHVLGIADHYDTLYQSGRTGVSQWDTMGGASYFNNQNTPPLFNAFERAELGWLDYTDIAADEAGWLPLSPLATDNMAYRITVPGTEGHEYFILENRIRQGWDRFLPGEGMLVWHVDMNEERWRNNTINTDAEHQYFDLVEADMKEDDTSGAADPFPGKANIRTFSFVSWNGEEAFSLDHISDSDTEMNILLGNTAFTLPAPEVSVKRIGGETLTFSWGEIEDAEHYLVSLTDKEGEPVGGYDHLIVQQEEPLTITSLTPYSDYTLEVCAKAGSYTSPSTVLHLTTTGYQFYEQTPTLLSISNIDHEGFTAQWAPLETATDYTITVEEQDYDQPTTSECDFSELPYGWNTSNMKFNKAMFGNSSPSLQMDNDGDWIEFSDNDIKIHKISFWVRSQTASNSVRVQILSSESDEWITVAEENLSTLPVTLEYDLPETNALRLVIVKQKGYVLIDDVKCEYQPVMWITESRYTDFSTAGECTFTAHNLKGNTLYRISATGISGNEYSRTAQWFVTTTSDSSVFTITGNGPDFTERYDLFGLPVSDDYRGIVIERRSDGTTRKLIKCK